jgi:hypothetical protein
VAERVSSSTAFARVLVSRQCEPVALQEPSDQIRNQVGLLVQSEVAGVEDTHIGARDVPTVRLSLIDLERRVVAAPDDLQRRLVLAEPVLPGRVTRDISANFRGQ